MDLAITRHGCHDSGFPVLCLHGHPGRGSCLDVFAEFLAPRFRTLAPDLRGYGRSGGRQPFAMEDHLTDLEALLDREGIERCLLLGWSLGGILALELALRQPERYSGLILIASAARPRGTHPPISTADLFWTGAAALLNVLHPGWAWNIETCGRRSLFRYLLGQQTPAAYGYLAAEAVPAYLQTSRAASQALNRALRAGYDRREALAQIQVPALVLAGECDRHISAASSQETAECLPQATWHCYPEVAHLFPWEIPARVCADIDTWLQAHPQVCA